MVEENRRRRRGRQFEGEGEVRVRVDRDEGPRPNQGGYREETSTVVTDKEVNKGDPTLAKSKSLVPNNRVQEICVMS